MSDAMGDDDESSVNHFVDYTRVKQSIANTVERLVEQEREVYKQSPPNDLKVRQSGSAMAMRADIRKDDSIYLRMG